MIDTLPGLTHIKTDIGVLPNADTPAPPIDKPPVPVEAAATPPPVPGKMVADIFAHESANMEKLTTSPTEGLKLVDGLRLKNSFQESSPQERQDFFQQLLIGNTLGPEDTQEALKTYALAGGDVDQLIADHQDIPALSEAKAQLKKIETDKQGFRGELWSQIQIMSNDDLNENPEYFEDFFRDYQTQFNEAPTVLLDAVERESLKNDPTKTKVYERIVATEEKLMKEQMVRADVRGILFAQQFIDDPTTPENLREIATDYATHLFQDCGNVIKNISLDSTDQTANLDTLRAQASKMGIKELDFEKKMEAIQEKTLDFWKVLGVRREDGSVDIGLAVLFGLIAALVIGGDILVSSWSGSQPIIPTVLEGVSALGRQLEQREYFKMLEKQYANDPVQLAYLKRQYSQNLLSSILLDEALRDRSSPRVAKAQPMPAAAA